MELASYIIVVINYKKKYIRKRERRMLFTISHQSDKIQIKNYKRKNLIMREYKIN